MTLQLVPRNPLQDAFFPPKNGRYYGVYYIAMDFFFPPIMTEKLSAVLKGSNTGLTFGFILGDKILNRTQCWRADEPCHTPAVGFQMDKAF